MSNLILPNGKIKNIKMVIFDKDGTLIDIHYYWCSMIEFRAKFFVDTIKNIDKTKLYDDLVDAMGINQETKKMKPEGPVGIKPRGFIIDTALNVLQIYDETYTKEMVENIFKRVDEYSKEHLASIVKPLFYVVELLEELTKADIKITIATTDLTNRAKLAMESLNLDKCFIDIVGADLVQNAKPSSDLVDYIVQKFNLSYDEIIVIGDSMADCGMAKNAKCRFIGVKSGLYTDKFLEADNIIDDLKQIKVEKSK